MSATAAAAAGGLGGAAGGLTAGQLIGINAAGQLGNSLFSYFGARRQNKHNIQLLKKSQAHELAMWQKQVDYNHPENQMQRLIDAGLNPHLIYGKPTEAAGNASGKPETFLPQVENELRDVKLPLAMDLIQSVQNYKNADIQHSISHHNLRNLGIKGDRMEIDLAYRQGLITAGLLDLEIDKLKSSISLAENNAERAKKETELKDLEIQMQKVLKQYGLTTSDHIGIRGLFMLMETLGLPIRQMIEKASPFNKK